MNAAALALQAVKNRAGLDGPADAQAVLTARAFEIADEAMFSEFMAASLKDDEFGLTVSLCDENSAPIYSLAEAPEHVQEAVEWLTARGYIELASDAEGEYVNVLRRPGEDEDAAH